MCNRNLFDTTNVTLRRKRVFDELPVERPKEDAPPVFGFELRPRFIQAGTEFKLICEVQAYPIPKVRPCGEMVDGHCFWY